MGYRRVSRDESRRLFVSAPERRATTATIDTGTAVASGVVLATTAGTVKGVKTTFTQPAVL
jgi:hypothetical protein